MMKSEKQYTAKHKKKVMSVISICTHCVWFIYINIYIYTWEFIGGEFNILTSLYIFRNLRPWETCHFFLSLCNSSQLGQICGRVWHALHEEPPQSLHPLRAACCMIHCDWCQQPNTDATAVLCLQHWVTVRGSESVRQSGSSKTSVWCAHPFHCRSYIATKYIHLKLNIFNVNRVDKELRSWPLMPPSVIDWTVDGQVRVTANGEWKCEWNLSRMLLFTLYW